MPAAMAALSDSLPPPPGMCKGATPALRTPSDSPWLAAHNGTPFASVAGAPSRDYNAIPVMSNPNTLHPRGAQRGKTVREVHRPDGHAKDGPH